MKHKVFIAPSVQTWNRYVTSGTEAEHMRVVANFLDKYLRQHKEFELYGNQGMKLQQYIKYSNLSKVDIHVAIHSNAANGKARGTEIWCWKEDNFKTNSQKLAECIYKYVAPLTPSCPDRGIKDGKDTLAEIKAVEGTSVIIELDFHDNKDSALWLAAHRRQCAYAIYKGICEYYGIEAKGEF